MSTLPPFRVMFIGDSLAGGYFATTIEQGYAALTRERLRLDYDLDWVVASKAGGDTKVVSVLDLPSDVDLVIVELGTNDSLHTLPPIFHRQYESLLRRVRETSPAASLVCMGVWRRRWRAWPYDRSIRRLAARFGGVYVGLSDLYADPTTRGPAGVQVENGISDNFHPNDEGHARITARLWSAVGLSAASRAGAQT